MDETHEETKPGTQQVRETALKVARGLLKQADQLLEQHGEALVGSAFDEHAKWRAWHLGCGPEEIFDGFRSDAPDRASMHFVKLFVERVLAFSLESKVRRLVETDSDARRYGEMVARKYIFDLERQQEGKDHAPFGLISVAVPWLKVKAALEET